MNSANRTLLGAVCFAITLILLLFGLWPLNFSPSNKAEWATDVKALRFYGQGIAYTRQPLEIAQTRGPSQTELTIELWVRPETEATRSVDRMMTLSDGDGDWLAIGQWKSSLIIRTRTPATRDARGYREAGLRHALVKGSDTFVTLTSNAAGVSIYTDGNLMRTVPGFSLLPPVLAGPSSIVLGNSPAGTQPWRGLLHGLAVYEKAFSADDALRHYRSWQQNGKPPAGAGDGLLLLYSFKNLPLDALADLSGLGNTLVVPTTFKPLVATPLEMPATSNVPSRSLWQDILVNIAGFVPFGFFVTAFLRAPRSRRIWLTWMTVLVLGSVISLSIELVQVHLPTRNSSALDLLCNMAGTAIGIVVCHYSRWKPATRNT